ncbi:hypothetical protein PHLCEN_2v3329 [Hermanssonia centrifuga]|uniref:Succinate dehydrogenase assembly factor 4, mitochondrial n=1 Tax=Hermanssonia centrifuga TaxID=98765 RepID=A0A2R6QMA3_9APHY|nr:hypothetical protein PHLCEN_2v3329 [Hermanssonia centrifuga]
MTKISTIASLAARSMHTPTPHAGPSRTLQCMRSHMDSIRLMSSSSSNPLNRPSPPPLPRKDQREFEDLVRKAQAPLSVKSARREQAEAELAMHPDARAPLVAEFEGEVNPTTGEKGGPKREPVRRWGEGDGDWSFKGRVSDF